MRRKFYLAGFIVVLLAVLFMFQFLSFHTGKLEIISCDVGQGDATFIRTPSGYEFLLDGGPDKSVLTCLNENMPFWDRTLDALILSHPHLDHFAGLSDVLKRYNVSGVFGENLVNRTPAYAEFLETVKEENVTLQTLERGNSITVGDGVTIAVLGPTAQFLSQENPHGIVENDNPPSLIMHVSYGTFDAVFAGDSDGEDITDFADESIARPELLLVPHHGSNNAFTDEAAAFIQPQIALISVGLHNLYHHPSPQVLHRLKNARVLRTDQNGSIHVVTDGTTISIQTEK